MIRDIPLPPDTPIKLQGDISKIYLPKKTKYKMIDPDTIMVPLSAIPYLNIDLTQYKVTTPTRYSTIISAGLWPK